MFSRTNWAFEFAITGCFNVSESLTFETTNRFRDIGSCAMHLQTNSTLSGGSDLNDSTTFLVITFRPTESSNFSSRLTENAPI